MQATKVAGSPLSSMSLQETQDALTFSSPPQDLEQLIHIKSKAERDPTRFVTALKNGVSFLLSNFFQTESNIFINVCSDYHTLRHSLIKCTWNADTASYSTPEPGAIPHPTTRGRATRHQLEELHRQCGEDSQAAFLSLPANAQERVKQGGSHSYQDSEWVLEFYFNLLPSL